MKTRLCVISGLLPVLAIVIATGCSKESRTNRAVERAEKLHAAGDYQAAEIEYFKALRLDPGQPVALSRLAKLYSGQGRWSLAAPLLAQAIKVDPEDLELRRRAGTLYLASGRVDDARAQAEFILQRQPTNTDAVLIMVEASRQPQEVEALSNRLEQLRQRAGDHCAFHLAAASMRIRSGDLDEAEAEVRRALELDPQSGVGQIVLGQIFSSQNRREESEAAFEKGFSMSPQDSLRRIQWPVYLLENGRAEEAYQLLREVASHNPGAVWVMVPLSRAALQLEKLDETERWVQAALKLDARNVEVRTLRAQLHLARGERDEAVDLLEQLSRDHPNSVRLKYQLALAYISSGDAVRAVSTLEWVLQLNPQFVPPRLMLAEIYLQQRDASSAFTILADLSERLPGDRRVQVLLAEAFAQSGSLDEAARIYRRLLTANPDDSGAVFRLGQVLLLQGKRAEARSMFETVVTQAPDYLPAVTYLADLDIQERDVPAALERLLAEVERHPDSATTRFLLGQTHLANGNIESAETQFHEVVRLAPDQPYGYLALVRLYTSQTNRLEDARAQLEALRAEVPEDPQALLMLALLEAAREDFSKARDLYEELLQSEPLNPVALNNLANLYATQLGNPDRAVELASQARQAAPRNAAIADTYGWALLQRGDYREALQILQEAAVELPANAEALHHLGTAYYMNGRESEARQCFENALRVGGDFKLGDEAEAFLKLLAIQSGNSDEETLALLQATLRDRPTDPVALDRLATAQRKLGESAKVLELYQRAYQVNSNSLPVLIGLAEAYSVFPNEATNAIELARVARKLAPHDPGVSHVLGMLAFRSGDFSWALSLLEESAAQRSGDAAVLRDLAFAYYSVGRLSDAERTVESAIGLGLELPQLERLKQFQQMLALQQNLGDPHAARQLAQEALAAEPESMAATMVVGLAAESLGDYDLAGASYTKVLGVYPEFVPAMKRLAVLAAEHMGDDALAYEYRFRAREALPNDTELASALGRVLYRRGDLRYATQLLQDGLGADPDNADLLYPLGFAQLRLERNGAGKETLTRALGLAPDHEMAVEARQALEEL